MSKKIIRLLGVTGWSVERERGGKVRFIQELGMVDGSKVRIGHTGKEVDLNVQLPRKSPLPPPLKVQGD